MRPLSALQNRIGSFLVVASITASQGALLTGCRVSEDDVHRWEKTVHGPDKLKAVLRFPKYETPLRVEAGMSLIRMKPRNGQSVGIEILVNTLSEVTPEERQAILSSLIPAMVAELKKAPPAPQAGQQAPPDPSFAFKDAAYALLTYDKTVLVADDALRGSLKQSLIEWAMADFERRLENRTQSYGMEQLLRLLGADSVIALPKLMTRDTRQLDKMALLVAELGNDATKEAGSKAIVDIAKYVVSEDWVKVKKPLLEEANKASKLAPTPKQFEMQLKQYQDEEFIRVLGALRRVGGRPAIDFALTFSANKDQSEDRRQAALAAVEGRLDHKNAEDLSRIFAIATSDAPEKVLDQAFRRIGEMPRKVVIEKLYETFKSDKWKIRRSSAVLVLKMSTAKDLDEFMGKLPDRDSKGFALPEAITYGAFISDLKEGNVRDGLKKHITSGSPAVRTTAVSMFYTVGTKDDLAMLQPLENDRSPAPVCDTDPDCKWMCVVPKEGEPNAKEEKEIKTLGDYVKFCVEPAINERVQRAAQAPKKDEKKEEKK